jgi:hypothetical protein
MSIIAITMIVLNLIIGSNQDNLKVLPISIGLFCIFVFLILKKIFFKEKIVLKNKIDLVIFLFFISTTFSFLLKTYCTKQGCVEFLLKYFFVYSIYLLVRNVVNSKSKVNILVTITICSSLIPIILGLDAQHYNVLNFVIEKLYSFLHIFGNRKNTKF